VTADNGFLEYQPAVIHAQDFPELHRLQIFTEIGADWVQRLNRPKDSDDTKPSAHELDCSAGLFVLFKHTAPTLEINAVNNTWNHHGTDNELHFTPGFLWRVRPEMELGIGFPVGLNQQSDHFEVIAHVVWEF